MNICYIAYSAIPSRTANSIHVMKMCQAYAGLGHEVNLVVPYWQATEGLANEDVYAFYGVRPEFAIHKIRLPRWCPEIFSYSVLLPLAALRSRPHLVHTRCLAPAWGLTRLFRQPTIFEIHSPPLQSRGQLKLFRQVNNSRHLQALVAITQALADHITPFLPQKAHLLVAPDGVDEGWLQQSLSQAEARTQLGLAQETRRMVVYTGHLYQGRGIELIIELAQQLPDHLFLLVGGREPDLIGYRQQLGESSNLRFEGFKPPAQMLLYLQAADALLMPYSHQTKTNSGNDTSAFASPMKMFEYMAAGRPILASTLPVLQEVLLDRVNALLLPYDQPQQWGQALQQLQQNPAFAAILGNQARSDVKQYTWEKRAQRLLEESGYPSANDLAMK